MDGVGPKFLGKAVACFSSTTFTSGRGVGVDGGHGKSQLSHRRTRERIRTVHYLCGPRTVAQVSLFGASFSSCFMNDVGKMETLVCSLAF